MGASPTLRMPGATGAVMEVTKWLSLWVACHKFVTARKSDTAKGGLSCVRSTPATKTIVITRPSMLAFDLRQTNHEASASDAE